MPIVFYTHPWMLSGLAALAVPLIIHLLLRRKKKRLRFSTLQFFVKQDQQSSQRRKLRNWLLLAMRLLLVALVVTAFARPFLPRGGASPAARQRRQAIFVLDRSASMLAVGTDGQRWTRAKELAQQALRSLDANDRAALVGCSSSHGDSVGVCRASFFGPNPRGRAAGLWHVEPGRGIAAGREACFDR